MLRIEVEYLMGKSYAAARNDEPEWPPHPARLFSALVAVAKEGKLGAAADEALLWFENQSPPELRAGLAGKAQTETCFVPPNYTKFREDYHVLPWARSLGNQERTFPAQSPSDPVVSFQWPGISDYPPMLAELVNRIGHLGRSSSLVRACVVDSPVEPTLIPQPTGPLALGVPTPGRLRELEECYRLNQRPRRPHMQQYGVAFKPTIRSAHGTVIVLRQMGGLGIPVEGTLVLTQAVRRALIATAESIDCLVEEIHGHGGSAHCIYMPLPFAGWEHSTGQIKGVGIVMPLATSAENEEKIYRACASLEFVDVPVFGRLGFASAGAQPLRTLEVGTWTGPAKIWGSVTPILLKHRPSRKFDRPLERMIEEYCVSSGLPTPVKVLAGRYGYLPGVPKAYDYRLRRKEEEPSERFAAHALIEFDRAVEGPILIGKARHFGLGLLRPLG